VALQLQGGLEDTPEQAAEQDLIIEAMNRALDYAHAKGVTLVAALGNNNEDISNPRPDTTSPDYQAKTEHLRTIDDSNCLDLPVEGPNVTLRLVARPVGEEGRLLELRHRPHLR
jgi:lantibiotic leader peptide-processing serine protease